LPLNYCDAMRHMRKTSKDSYVNDRIHCTPQSVLLLEYAAQQVKMPLLQIHRQNYKDGPGKIKN